MGAQQVSIYQYEDYRTFLKDFFLNAKSHNKKYSYRYISRIAGFVSPSHVKRIIDGERNLSLEGIEKLGKALKLTHDETIFFKNLVLLNQSSTNEEKEIHARELLRSHAYRKIHPLSLFQFRYYAKWYYIPVRELVALPGFKEDPQWIAQTIIPSITPEEAQGALKELIDSGLLIRDSLGKLVQANSNIIVPNSITSSFYIRYHKDMLSRAASAIDKVPRDKRDISNVTFGVSAQAMEKIKEMIKKFREEVLEESAKDPATTSVYQLNLQLFPLAEIAAPTDKENK